VLRGWTVFVGASLAGILAITCRGQWQAHPAFEEANVAIHLVRGDGFASPFYFGSGQAPSSAYCPPVYPILIALCFLIARSHGAILLLLINSLCMGAIAWSLYQLGRRYASISAGLCAAILVVIHPSFLFYAGDLWDAFVALALFLLIIVHAAPTRLPRRLLFHSTLLGASMGLLALTNPSYALSFPLIALAALRGCSAVEKLKAIAICALAMALVLAPWTVRNYQQFHRIYFVRDELNFELLEGNPSYATGWMGSELRDRNLNFSPALRQLLLEMGETNFFDWCGQQFHREYSADPLAFWRRTARRAVYIFISDPTQAQLPFPLLNDVRFHRMLIDRLLLHSLLAIGGLAGAWTAWRLRLGCGWIFWAGFLTAVPFLFCNVDDRYVLPFRSVLILFTAILFWATLFRFVHGAWPAAEVTEIGVRARR
jgi:hypothetical protein